MTLFAEAQKWIDRGIAVLPIKPHSKQPLIPWKCYQSELPTIIDLIKWFQNGQNNLAVICGWQDLVVLDFDDIVEYVKFIDNYSQFKRTYTVSTSRGMHVYVYCKGGKTRMTSGLDIKASGYVLAPPSIHPSGKRYGIEVDAPILRVDSLPMCHASRDLPSTVLYTNIVINGDNNTVNVHTTNCTRRQGIINRIKDSYPIAALFPPVKLTGNGMAFAHCPTDAHPNGDRDPSLSLDLINNRCQCISRSDCPLYSPHGNDVIDAYQILHELSFHQALAMMAEELGI